MIIQCQNCGAPLDVRDSVPFVDCTYCGRSNKVASTRTLNAITPPNWQPPAQWTEADRERAATVAMAGVGVAAATTGLTGCIVVGIAVAIVGTLGAAVAGFLLWGASREAPSASSVAPVAAWNGATPFRCSGGDEVVLTGVTANLPNDVAITVSGNCELTLVDSSITARVGLEGDSNGVIRLRNSVLRGSEAGARLSMNQDLELEGGEISSAGVGIEASGNSEVTLLRGRVEGHPAVRTSLNAELANRGAEIVER